MPVLAVAFPVAWVGLTAALCLAAFALVSADPRLRARAMVAALAIAPVAVLPQAVDALESQAPARLVVVGAAGLMVIVALAALIARRPSAFALLAVGALAFRVPVDLGGQAANLLVPLYLVIAAGALAAVWRTRNATPPPEHPGWLEAVTRPSPAGLLRGLLCATLVLFAVQAAYSLEVEEAAKQVAFFLVPFAVLFRLILDLEWTPRLLYASFAVIVGFALAFSLVGFWEYETKKLLWNPKVISSNAFEDYFRVNSVFWDPNIYGRYLAVAMTVCAAVLVWARRPRTAVTMAACLAVLWGGLLLTFSQSSMAGLLVGLAVVGGLRWSARWAAGLAAAGLVAAAVLVVGFGDAVRVDISSERSLDEATSGRAALVRGGVELAASRPVTGYGSGSFSRAYRRQEGSGRREAVTASHTAPITVAAEQGLPGLLLYAGLVVAMLRAALVGIGGLVPGVGQGSRGGGPEDAVLAAARAGIAAALCGLLLHTLAYAAFLSDPLTWVLAALAASLATAPQPQDAPAGVGSPEPVPA